MHPVVSIQIPTYNQQQFIKRTVESCLMQDYPNLEINVADDGSSDGTAEIMKGFLDDPRVKYYRNEKNIGRVANYHKALYEYATGEWAINLDGDDYFIDPGFISKAIRLILSLKDKDICIYQGNHDIDKIKTVLPESEMIDRQTLCVKGTDYFINYPKILHFQHCATVYNRAKALTLNFYSFPGLFTDFNSMAKLFLKGDILVSSDKVAYWNQHAQNESNNLNSNTISTEIRSIAQIAAHALSVFPEKTVKKWRIKMKGYLLSLYVDMQKGSRLNRQALKQLIINFSPDAVHFRQLAKALLVLMGFRNNIYSQGNRKKNDIR